MDARNELLLLSAARLYSLGLDLEAARESLRQMVERGVPYGAEELRAALWQFKELEAQWKEMERQHLALREELINEENR